MIWPEESSNFGHQPQRVKGSKQTHSCVSRYIKLTIENITHPCMVVQLFGTEGTNEYSPYLSPELSEHSLYAVNQRKRTQ
jgi:hypothetical protein